jgi:septal ring factor EnvC (AmiA/AmiB activator)
MPVFLVKLWLYIKKYWAYVALILGIIAAIVFFRKEQLDFADELKKIQEAHDEELRKIEEAREQERREHEANLKRLQETLAEVQKHYDDAKKDLDDKKKKEIADLVKQYGNDPDELAKKLSEATGFTIVLP